LQKYLLLKKYELVKEKLLVLPHYLMIWTPNFEM